MKTFYKAAHFVSEEGSVIYFKEFKQLHETNCYAYCLEDSSLFIAKKFSQTGKDLISAITNQGYKVNKIHKDCSRFAFATKQLAFEHFKMLKSRQIIHIERDLRVYKKLLESVGSKSLDELEGDSFRSGSVIVRETQSVILGSFIFD